MIFFGKLFGVTLRMPNKKSKCYRFDKFTDTQNYYIVQYKSVFFVHVYTTQILSVDKNYNWLKFGKFNQTKLINA